MRVHLLIICLLSLFLAACNEATPTEEQTDSQTTTSKGDALLQKYTPFKLTSDLSVLSEKEKQMIPLLIDAAKIMDDLFWYEAYGDKNTFLNSIEDPKLKEFAKINYGPWDRLDGNKPFIEAAGEKPLGANFYPKDMTKEELEQSDLADKAGLYSLIRRKEDKSLEAIPYHVQFKEQVTKASDLLKKAAELAEDEGLKKYLTLRAAALLNDDYFESDMAWMDMKTNGIDVVIGPIETYEDQLFGYRAAHEAYVLIKDKEWSKRLEKYVAFLPELQEGLPVEAAYKKEKPGSDADLNAYDVIYYAGDCNSGSKTIAINLPNDEKVQLEKGARRLQLKNAMKAKFDKILLPISEVLIDPSQRQHITFNAFFSNTMFHEVAHGLGIKNTLDGKGTVREALKEHASAIEEGKADILGLYMINQLHKKGELKEELKNFYVTFMAGIFRSVRFGSSSAHGKANMIRFNFFKQHGAFERDAETGFYKVNFEKFQAACEDLTRLILVLQGDGDYNGVAEVMKEKAVIKAELQGDLDRLSEANIPVDIIFEQGKAALGL